MTKTSTELAYRALRNLGALPQGQTPAAEDLTSMVDLISPMLFSLSERNIVYVPNMEAIPEEWFLPLASCLAWIAAPEFGAASDPALASIATQAEQQLKKMQANPPTYAVLEIDSF